MSRTNITKALTAFYDLRDCYLKEIKKATKKGDDIMLTDISKRLKFIKDRLGHPDNDPSGMARYIARTLEADGFIEVERDDGNNWKVKYRK